MESAGKPRLPQPDDGTELLALSCLCVQSSVGTRVTAGVNNSPCPDGAGKAQGADVHACGHIPGGVVSF